MKPLYLLFLLSMYGAKISNAQQNLIQNGGFEERGKMDCLHCNLLYGKFPALVHHWDNEGWGCVLCDKQYKQNADELKGPVCPLGQIAPVSGDCMVAMQYYANCNGKYGVASRLCAPVTKTLEVGHLFEVNCWLYIKSDPKADPNWAKHIGIALSPQKISLRSFVHHIRTIPALTIDTVLYDQWYQVRWRVRPLCNSNFLTIGIFGDDGWSPVLNAPVMFYYVDNIKVIELSSESIGQDSAAYYCSQYDPEKNPDLVPQLDNGSLFFSSTMYELTGEHKATLDSLASFARKYPDLVFEITGHTDSIGADNIALSNNRAQSVLHYLTEVQHVPVFRFSTRGIGSVLPSRSNATESGRKWNRSVQITQANIDVSGMFYRMAVQAVADQRLADAFVYLNKWVKKARQTDQIMVFFDPRFAGILKDKRWPSIEKNIRAGYSVYKYPDYAFRLDSLQMAYDRVMGRLSWAFCELSSDSVPYSVKDLPEADIQYALKKQFAGLEAICAKIGWPTRTDFKEHGANAAFLILQHSGDTTAYQKWLPVFQKNCAAGEASWEHYAMLYDRCNIFTGKPQRYGTQFKILENGEVVLHCCEGDEHVVNQNLIKLGLPMLPAIVMKCD